MGPFTIAGFVLLIGGQAAWKLAAMNANAWLKQNAPEYQEPSVAAKLLAGGLFTSFGPMKRYGELAETKGASTVPVYAFWSGLFVSLVGGVVIFASVVR